MTDQRAGDIRQQALQNALRLGILGLGGGAVVRGLSGMLNLHRRNRRERKPSVHAPVVVDYPLPAKTAADFTTTEGWAEGARQLGRDVSDFLSGGKATTPGGWPFAMPLGVGSFGLGMYGGYRLADWLLDKRRKQELESDYQAARQEYEDALAEKPASDLGRALDALFDKLADHVTWEKSASEKEANTGWDALGYMTGLGLTGLGALSLGTGALTYNLLKKQTSPEILRKARLRERRRESLRSPAPLLVLPERSGSRPEDEEAEE